MIQAKSEMESAKLEMRMLPRLDAMEIMFKQILYGKDAKTTKQTQNDSPQTVLRPH